MKPANCVESKNSRTLFVKKKKVDTLDSLNM